MLAMSDHTIRLFTRFHLFLKRPQLRWPLIAVCLFMTACASAPEAPEAGETDPPPAAQPWQPDADAQTRYIELVEQAQSDHASVDYEELRELYVRTLYYQPYAGAEQQFSDAMFESLERGRLDHALQLAGRILEENYVSLDAHYVARQVYADRGDERRRARHDYMLRALFQAIRDSGDGEGRGSAYQVISTREVQTFIALYGLDVMESDLEADELGTHDRIVVRDPLTDEQHELWFDISAQWHRGFDGF